MLMRALHRLVVDLGSRVSPGLLVASLLALNVAWLLILGALDAQFWQVTGYPLPDLQNDLAPETMMTPARFLNQVSSYSQEARTLYWAFFILDNIMPQLSFGAFALLWVVLLRHMPWRWAARLLASPLLLIPLGVGLFDWVENVAYVWVISQPTDQNVLAVLYVSLVAKWIKGACVMLTMFGTLPLLGAFLVVALRQRRRLPAGPPTP
jgi:hypothetical protein